MQSGTQVEKDETESAILLTIDGAEESIIFGCQSAPSLYSVGYRQDGSAGKYLYDQGYQKIPLQENRALAFDLIMYTDIQIEELSASELKELLETNPQLLEIEVSLEENDLVYQNQFQELPSLQSDYANKKIVAENEVLNFELGEIKSFECFDDASKIVLNLEYQAIIKTKDQQDQKSISLNLQIFLGEW